MKAHVGRYYYQPLTLFYTGYLIDAFKFGMRVSAYQNFLEKLVLIALTSEL